MREAHSYLHIDPRPPENVFHFSVRRRDLSISNVFLPNTKFVYLIDGNNYFKVTQKNGNNWVVATTVCLSKHEE